MGKTWNFTATSCASLFSENQPCQSGANGHSWLSEKMLFANGLKQFGTLSGTIKHFTGLPWLKIEIWIWCYLLFGV